MFYYFVVCFSLYSFIIFISVLDVLFQCSVLILILANVLEYS